MNSGSEFLQRLLRKLYASEAISAAYLGGDLARSAADSIERVDLHLATPGGFRAAMAAWLAPLGGTVYSGPDAPGWRAVTEDGVEWLFHLYDPAEPLGQKGLQPLFDRREPPPGVGASGIAAPGIAAPAGGAIDLTLMAGRFWSDLLRVANALGREQPLTVHGHLEACRIALVDLYRLALAPGREGGGWEGADSLPGLHQALESVWEWLVVPLEPRAQLRSAHRLAAAYESLMLPLCQRLGVEYPMAIRNLVFARLERIASGSGGAAHVAAPGEPPAPEPEPQGPARPGRMRVAKGRIARPD